MMKAPMTTSDVEKKHPLEEESSWQAFVSRRQATATDSDADTTTSTPDRNLEGKRRRNLRHHYNHHDEDAEDDATDAKDASAAATDAANAAGAATADAAADSADDAIVTSPAADAPDVSHAADASASAAAPTSDEERHEKRGKHHHQHHEDDANEKRKDRNDDDFDPIRLENLKAKQDLQRQESEEKMQIKRIKKQEKKRRKRFAELYRNSGIGKRSVHGLMIDAGSTGSRMHIYEYEPRILANKFEVAEAVTGRKLSYPGIESRWTERLRPGISEFADISDDVELERALAEYLEPLLSFAQSVLHTKREEFSNFPIFLKATAGLRTLSTPKRQRVISTVRKLFANDTYCPFWDEDERVRVISGEEEAVYGWAGVNFLLGHLMQNSEGAGEAGAGEGGAGGTIRTFGALDMGGASTQISFYQPEGDVMSGLFKLQIGQGKHWNVYAHSHLMFGMNMAEARRKARLVRNTLARERLVEGVYDPCLPGGAKVEFKSDIHFDARGMETWDGSVDDFDSWSNSDVEKGLYHAILVNEEEVGDWERCKGLARDILNEDSNAWCQFSHRGSCSFAGVYQPQLPTQEASFGEFYAFSNYYHVWQFLQLEARSSIEQLEERGKEVCAKSWDQLLAYNKANTHERYSEEELASYCFHAAYVHEILRHGYGFQPQDHIIATDVVNGQKVTWALGSILYEINTLPWDYIEVHSEKHIHAKVAQEFFSNWGHDFSLFMTFVILGSVLCLVQVFRWHRLNFEKSRKEGYEALSEAKGIEIEKLIHSH